MKVIGLTGGIGTSKSTVSAIMAELGAIVIDADKIGHEAYRPHSETWQAVVEAFGPDIIGEGDQIDRRRLGQIVFNDPGAMERLNSIMHPRMFRTIESNLAELRQKGADIVVLEAAILLEAHWEQLVDEVWVTYATEDEVIRRIQGRNNLSEVQIRARIGAQMPQEERLKHADVVIDTNCTLEEERQKIVFLWQRLHGEGEAYQRSSSQPMVV